MVPGRRYALRASYVHAQGDSYKDSLICSYIQAHMILTCSYTLSAGAVTSVQACGQSVTCVQACGQSVTCVQACGQPEDVTATLLAGYSAILIGQKLPKDGRLVTYERDLFWFLAAKRFLWQASQGSNVKNRPEERLDRKVISACLKRVKWHTRGTCLGPWLQKGSCGKLLMGATGKASQERGWTKRTHPVWPMPIVSRSMWSFVKQSPRSRNGVPQCRLYLHRQLKMTVKATAVIKVNKRQAAAVAAAAAAAAAAQMEACNALSSSSLMAFPRIPSHT
eukprot:1161516-Pelagomonas_calceolata.AAC.4